MPRLEAAKIRIRGIGIDLIDKKRIQKLIQRNPHSVIPSLFTKSEIRKIGRRNARFALLFAAKEAFFKAVGGAWLGLENFPEIEVRYSARDHFQVESAKYKVCLRDGTFAEGQFFECGDLVGAQVTLWNSKS